jgi:lipoprotein-releasing system permease protein
LYKLLLCWRYLRTRYLALACIISVMLGVGTLIVVNSVMSGFSTKLRDRLHGLLSDVLIEGLTMDGFADPSGKMAQIRKDPFLGPRIEAMTPTLEVFALLEYVSEQGDSRNRPVHLIGIDPATRAKVGGFQEFLVRQKNAPTPSFDIPPEARPRLDVQQRLMEPPIKPVQIGIQDEDAALPPPPPAPASTQIDLANDKQLRGVILGNLIASYPRKTDDGRMVDHYVLQPGDIIFLTTISGSLGSGQKVGRATDGFVVVDYSKSDMSDYDNNYVFVPLPYLQRLRAMDDRVTSIQIKLRNYDEAKAVVKVLEKMFPQGHGYSVRTWEDKQGALLQAIAIERGILNVLLFLIIAVAGFGILAIFSMIVAEKTRDIGILKALGSSNMGVMSIFLGYGLLLGVLGAGLGTGLGLAMTTHINDVEKVLTKLTGHEVFDRQVYYFKEIPTYVQAQSVVLVNLGAVAIAVLFSVLPALRAALLHPVQALRYE